MKKMYTGRAYGSSRVGMHLDSKRLQRSMLLQEKFLPVPDGQNPQPTLKWQLSFTSEMTTHGIRSITLGFCFTFQSRR